MMTTPKVSFAGITPYLHYDDIGAMIAWLTRVFGFTEKGRWLDAAGSITNAELCAGSSEIWLDGDPGWWKQRGRRPEEWIGVWVDDVDSMHARVKAAGLNPEPPQCKFYAVRVLQVTDPEGYTWGFLQRAPYIAHAPET
jgi:uncharacterized glyoxalase superfamily protein PhnB